MKIFSTLTFIICLITSCATVKQESRIIEDFNYNWKFNLGDAPQAFSLDFDDANWDLLNLPHDWSIHEGYQKDGTASSTGFVPGGIGWYRKSFKLPEGDKGKKVSIMFDGVYNNSSVWINGHLLGKRPYGYSSFSYDLTDHLTYGDKENIISVKVNHKNYVDSRWYTGSGIYRKVQLIKTAQLHVAQWGVQITTPKVIKEQATVDVKVDLVNPKSKFEDLKIKYQVFDQKGSLVKQEEAEVNNVSNKISLIIDNPTLWSLDSPNLYSLKVEVLSQGKLVDDVTEVFGIRTFDFDANTGFSLNGKRMKIKGVNLHHDAGAVGAAVPKSIWEYRIDRLKSIGVNAIRFAHNPHSKELLEACDEMGILVMNEAFDEWHIPKKKSQVHIGDDAAPEEFSRAYPKSFNEWAERDLKDLIRRDFNHPSVIMWSIGNEIEWTFPHYSKTYEAVNGKVQYYKFEPNYDSLTVKNAMDKITGGNDPLAKTAKKLSKWVKEMDTTRPVTCGNVHPSIGLASGYADNVDVLGFNYRAVEYDAAHKRYPNLKILGSENWGAYSEWKNCADRDFVAGIFLWTGFAYLGEAGPWPRKGLDISLFDFAGFKNPRGHFFECLWKDDPKVYVVTTPAEASEYTFDDQKGWTFTMQKSPPPVWEMLRLWEWYKVYDKWKYEENESIIVQTYTNCEEAELFLNGKSLGKQKRTDFSEDNIIKWLVPFNAGELKVLGYNNGKQATTYILNTHQTTSKLVLESNKKMLTADGYEVAMISASLVDENNNLVADGAEKIEFNISGPGENIGIDNGWDRNIQSHQSNSIVSHNGKALLIVQATKEKGAIKISASAGKIKSNVLELMAN